MVSCLLIFGLEKSGKTYSSNIIQNTLDVKCIHFDFILGIITECIRIVFENDILEKSFIHRWTGVFQDDKKKNQFNNDIIKLIRSNTKSFESIYESSIRGTVNHIEYRRRNDPKLKRPRVGHVGWKMREFAFELISLVHKNIIENSKFCIMEGRVFKNRFYRQAVHQFFEQTLELECFYSPQKNIEKYFFQQKEYDSLTALLERINQNVKEILN